jgi:uncharacterized membrane protein
MNHNHSTKLIPILAMVLFCSLLGLPIRVRTYKEPLVNHNIFY